MNRFAKTLVVGSLLATLFCSVTIFAADTRQNLSHALARLGYEEIPLRVTGENRLYIFAKINGRKRSCLVDSGWSFTTISTNTAAGLERSNTVDLLELNTVLLTNEPVVVQDMRVNGQPASFDLVLGCDFLLSHHAILDYSTHRLFLRRSVPTSAEILAFEKVFSGTHYTPAQLKVFDPPAITVNASLNSHTNQLLVDSGAMFSCLDITIAKQINLRFTASPNQISSAVSSDRKNFGVSTIEKVRIGEHLIRDVNIAVLSLADWGFGPDGKLFKEVTGVLGGSELLSMHAVIDFNSQKLWMR